MFGYDADVKEGARNKMGVTQYAESLLTELKAVRKGLKVSRFCMQDILDLNLSLGPQTSCFFVP